MSRLSRRSFLRSTLAAAATITIAGTKSSGRVLGSNDVIRIAVIGTGRQGNAHINRYLDLKKDVQIVYLVDPDPNQWNGVQVNGTGPLKKQGPLDAIKERGNNVPKTDQNFRKALEDKDVDAVSIVTPNHWHALIALHALKAGKHVYVEKPCSHNIHESQVLAEAAKKSGKIVQHGTQTRSMTDAAHAIAVVQSGQLGKLLVARGFCRKARPAIGFQKPSDPPKGMNFDLWTGPAPLQPFHGNLAHYNWHWFWDFGNGEIGNQGVHQMDVARWAIGEGLPVSVLSVGGRWPADQGQTPNTQIALMDYGPGKPQLLFEVRGMKTEPYMGEYVGNVFELEGGTIFGKSQYQLLPKGSDKPQPLPKVDAKYQRGDEASNYANFVAAIRSGNPSDLWSPIDEGAISSSLCHLANISYRLGQESGLDSKEPVFSGSPAAEQCFQEMKSHLQDNKVDLKTGKFQLGKKLSVDPKSPQLFPASDKEARAMLTRDYRNGYELPS